MADDDRKPPRKRSDAAMGGMVATLVLLVLVGLTVVFVWVGG